MNSSQTRFTATTYLSAARPDLAPGFFLMWLLALAVLLAATPAQAQSSYKTQITPQYRHLLILHSYGQGSASVQGVNQGLDFVLSKNDFQVLKRVEHMDMGGNASPRYLELLEELLTIKYQGAQFDGILVSGIPALNMAARLRDKLCMDTAIMAAGIDISGALPENMSDIYIATDEPPHARTLALALEQNPAAKRILIINRPPVGAPETGTALGRDLRALSERYEVNFVPNDGPNSMEIALSDAKAQDVVYLAEYFRTEDNGLDLSTRDVRRMAYACKVPIYTSRAQFMGTGVLGGRLTSWTEQGKRAAWLLLGHWQGRYVRKIDTDSAAGERTLYDHHALKRFGITPDGQSDGQQIINEPETTLDIVRKVLDIRYVGAVFFLLIILMVLIHRRRTRESRKKLTKTMGK
ncbi:MAG: hypothetical protein KKE73_10055 [Proteobacteria bacterium]|nr:hypothetical protein [Pseudomonadota bacterium]